MKISKIPFPGYGLAVIDTTQMSNVNFKGDDRFDSPQSGTLIKITKDDETRSFSEDGTTYGALLNKKIWWAKYADADATLWDDDLEKDIVFIQLDKLRGYEL